jgi:hypothetical protein
MNTDDQMKLQPVPGATPAAQSARNATEPSRSYESDSLPSDLFEDQFEFIDDIHGQISLNRLERDVIDSPEFQRLFRLSQLGFVDLVYPTANHTRAVHSIGACHVAALPK